MHFFQSFTDSYRFHRYFGSHLAACSFPCIRRFHSIISIICFGSQELVTHLNCAISVTNRYIPVIVDQMGCADPDW